MKVTIEMFGGNKDNYYNFKQNFLSASRQLDTASSYVNPAYAKTNLCELDNLVFNLKHAFDPVEFED